MRWGEGRWSSQWNSLTLLGSHDLVSFGSRWATGKSLKGTTGARNQGITSCKTLRHPENSFSLLIFSFSLAILDFYWALSSPRIEPAIQPLHLFSEEGLLAKQMFFLPLILSHRKNTVAMLSCKCNRCKFHSAVQLFWTSKSNLFIIVINLRRRT